jgi:PhoPQ-activated pathogenicity-related protein
VNASGDQFFVPDSSQFYFDSLIGEKQLRYVPNADHSLRGSDAIASITAFYQMVLNNQPRPKVSWKFDSDGSIRVVSQPKPQAAQLWQATNPSARDFRIAKIGKAFSSQSLSANDLGEFVCRVEAPEQGWTAAFVELTFDTGSKFPLKVSTAVRVLPDRRPHAGIDPAQVPYEP